MPAQVLQLGLLLWIYDNLHAHLIQIIYLALVENLELDPHLRTRVRHLEEKPLRIPTSINIVLQQKIILVIWNLRCHRQIPTLKPRLKDQSFVLRGAGRVERQQRSLGRIGCLLSWFSTWHFGDIACPNVPILLYVVDLAITLLLVLSINHIVKRLPDPVVKIVLLHPRQRNRLVKRLEIWNEADKSGKRQHRGERFWFVTHWFWQKHEGRGNEVFWD